MSRIQPIIKEQQSFPPKKKNEENNLSSKSEKVILNLRGTKFEIPLSCLDNWPETRLGRLKSCIATKTTEHLKELCDDFDLLENEFYLNKDPYAFNIILEYYNNEKIHFDESKCAAYFKKQLNYWGLNELECFDDCCELKFFDKCESIRDDLDKQNKIIENYEIRHHFNSSCVPKLRENLWILLEKPRSSKLAIVKRKIIKLLLKFYSY